MYTFNIKFVALSYVMTFCDVNTTRLNFGATCSCEGKPMLLLCSESILLFICYIWTSLF